MEFVGLVAAVLIISLFVIVIMAVVIQRNLRDRVNDLEGGNDNNETPPISPATPISPISPVTPPSNSNLREDCFSFEPSPFLFASAPNDFNANLLWRQERASEGSTIEEVDLSLIPVKANSNPVVIGTNSFGATVTHVPDLILLPNSNTLNTLRVESPLSSGGITLPFKGLETDGGSSGNPDSFEFNFDSPVGILSFDTLDLRSSMSTPTVIRLWDEDGNIFWQETIIDDYDASLAFVGISDPLNRIKTARIGIGSTTTSNQNEWSITNISIGENPPYASCDVSRVINSDSNGIEVVYRNNSNQNLITDPEIIQELLIDP